MSAGVKSMTGFARVDGHDERVVWFWEARSVNGRGLDVRLRLPPGSESLEGPARKLAGERLTRGNVTLQLTQRRSEVATRIVVNPEALAQVLDLARSLQAEIGAPPPAVEGLLALRGVIETIEAEEAEKTVTARDVQQLNGLVDALDRLVKAREGEGRRLAAIIEDQLARIEQLVAQVAASPARTPDAIAARLGEQIARLIGEKAADFDPDRLHQEAVLLAARADIEEELQRLGAHIAGARDLLSEGGAIGRRFDFLVQEFNREANTLCSKSNDTDMTRAGLEMKAIIDQMREQVQNIE